MEMEIRVGDGDGDASITVIRCCWVVILPIFVALYSSVVPLLFLFIQLLYLHLCITSLMV